MHNEARHLLESIAATYASMTSYSDIGYVVQHLQPEHPPLRTDFSTLYAKPNLFRFEFSRHMDTRHVVGFDGFGAYVLREEDDMPPIFEARRELSQAVSSVAGLSAGSAHNIARLLLLEVDGLSILDLAEARLVDDEVIDGIPCHRICARLPMGGERKLSFERNSLLLRRIETRRGSVALDELHLDIRVNLPLDDEMFDIESPDQSACRSVRLMRSRPTIG